MLSVPMKIKKRCITIAYTSLLVLSASATNYAHAVNRYDGSKDKEILGQDMDLDGVRDDIQSYLNDRYGGQLIIKRLLTRYSIAIDNFMLGSAPIASAEELDAAKNCAISFGYSGEEFIRMSSIIYQRQVNTPVRKLAMGKSERFVVLNGYKNQRNKPYNAYCKNTENHIISK